MERVLYIFLDEGGNLDFSDSGTAYFVLTAVSKERPFHAYRFLNELKYDLMEKNVEVEYFHASENKQDVRDAVFSIIKAHLDRMRIDTLVVNKPRVADDLRRDEVFYPVMLKRLLYAVIKDRDLGSFDRIIVVTDSIPVNRKRRAVEKAVKKEFAALLPSRISYTICHHSSKSNYDLQIADYCNWAIYRKQGGDVRSFDIIQGAVGTESVV
jgi:hypothetical protein